jgi:hypothetical protein
MGLLPVVSIANRNIQLSSHNSPEIRHKEQILAMTPGLR